MRMGVRPLGIDPSAFPHEVYALEPRILYAGCLFWCHLPLHPDEALFRLQLFSQRPLIEIEDIGKLFACLRCVFHIGGPCVDGIYINAFRQNVPLNIINGSPLRSEGDYALMLLRCQLRELILLHELELNNPEEDEREAQEKEDKYDEYTSFCPIYGFSSHFIKMICPGRGFSMFSSSWAIRSILARDLRSVTSICNFLFS